MKMKWMIVQLKTLIPIYNQYHLYDHKDGGLGVLYML